MKYTAIVGNVSFDIELGRADAPTIEADIGGRKYTMNVEAVEPGVYWFEWDHRSIEITVTPNGDTYTVSVGGRHIDVEIVDARAALRKATQHGDAGAAVLRAPMPGKVVKVLVSEGAAVEINQGLLVIEAMKMQNEVKSPKAGVVQKVAVKETDAVNAGDLLVVVE